MGFLRWLHDLTGTTPAERAAGFARDAVRRWKDGDRTDPLSLLSGVEEADRKRCFEALVVAFRHEDEDATAADLLRRGAALFPNDPEVLHWIASVEGDPKLAEEIYRTILRSGPDLRASLRLADILTATGRAAEVAELLAGYRDDPMVDLRLARAAFALGKREEAIPILERSEEYLHGQMNATFFRNDHQEISTLWNEVRSLLQEVSAEEYGREMTIVRDAFSGRLDGRAGANYTLLGMSLMPKAARRARSLDLRTPREDLAEAAERLARDARDSGALTLRGCAELRLERLDDAHRSFDAACEADGKNFAAFLGLGAVLDAERERFFARARALPDVEAPPGLGEIVSAYEALTPIEQRVVRAMTWPLRGAFRALREAKARMRILPIDVRSIDLPEFAGLEDVRFEDHRTFDALTGLASEKGIALSKIETLLEVETQNGSVFAHELAHLVHYFLPEETRKRIEDLYVRSASSPHVLAGYASSNVFEFFACTYVDYVQAHYRLRTWKELDEEGVLASIFAFFDELAVREDFDS